MRRIYWIPDNLEKWDALCADLKILYPTVDTGDRVEVQKAILAFNLPVVLYASSIESALLQFPSLRPWKDEFFIPIPFLDD